MNLIDKRAIKIVQHQEELEEAKRIITELVWPSDGTKESRQRFEQKAARFAGCTVPIFVGQPEAAGTGQTTSDPAVAQERLVSKSFTPWRVRLVPFTKTITAEAGWIIDCWFASQKCPECGKRGRERAGAEFQHMNRCTDCVHVWTPETCYLRIRLPNDQVEARRP